MNTTMALVMLLGLLAPPVQGQGPDAKGAKETARESVADSVLTSRVKAASARDKEVSALRIKLESDDEAGVTLSGTAKTRAEADKSMKIGRETTGVSSAGNEIRVPSR